MHLGKVFVHIKILTEKTRRALSPMVYLVIPLGKKKNIK
jgi:hypothetical protein